MGQLVYVVTDESKSSYDAGGVFVGVFSSYEMAIAYVDRRGAVLDQDYGITEAVIDSE